MTALPATMQCIAISKAHGLEQQTRPTPQAGKGEVLLRVVGIGVNRPDVLQRRGLYPPPPGASDLPGLEVSGEVVAYGEKMRGVDFPALGTPVCALVNGGGYGEYVSVDARHCLSIPEGLDMIEAAALPETFFTVWHNVFERGQLIAGEYVLVHGGSSGIGTTAIQLAHQFGATVIATAGTDEKCHACEKLGASLVINYQQTDFVTAVQDFTSGRGVDVVLDMVGGDYIPRNIATLAEDGRLINIAYLAGSKVTVDFMPVMLKRLTLSGSTLRARTPEFKAELARTLENTVWPLITLGKIRPQIHSVFPMTQAADAHALMESSRHIGKIMLKTGN